MKHFIVFLFLCFSLVCAQQPKLLVMIPQNHSVDYIISQRLYRELLFKLSQKQMFNPMSHDEVLWKLDSLGLPYWDNCQSEDCLFRLADDLQSQLIIKTIIQSQGKLKIIELSIFNRKDRLLLFNDKYSINEKASLEKFVDYWINLRFGTSKDLGIIPEGVKPYQTDYTQMALALGAEGVLGTIILWNSLDLFSGDKDSRNSASLSKLDKSDSDYRGFFSTLPEGFHSKSRGRGGVASAKDIAGTSLNPANAYNIDRNTWQFFKESSDYGIPTYFIGFGSNFAPSFFHSQSIQYGGDELSSEWTLRSTWASDLSTFSRVSQGIRIGLTLKAYMAKAGSECKEEFCQSGKTLGYGVDLGLIAQPISHLKWGFSIEDPWAYLWHHNTYQNTYYRESLTTRWRMGIALEFEDYEINSDWVAKTSNFETNRMSIGIETGPEFLRFAGGAYFQPGINGGSALTSGLKINWDWDNTEATISWAAEWPIEGMLSRKSIQHLELGLFF